jgi:hypothetical protein
MFGARTRPDNQFDPRGEIKGWGKGKANDVLPPPETGLRRESICSKCNSQKSIE